MIGAVTPALRRQVFVCLVAATACAPDALSRDTAVDTERVRAEVLEASQALLTAMNASDGEAVLGFYVDGPELRYLGCTEFFSGKDDLARLVEPFYAANAGVTFEQNVVSVQVLGPDAALVMSSGGASDAGALFWTQLWVRTTDGWRVAAEHESWPGCREPRGPHPFTTAPDSAMLRPPGG